jgi:hypothetical protein
MELDGTKKVSKVKLDNFPVFSTKKQEKSIFAENFAKYQFPHLAFKIIFSSKTSLYRLK